MSYTMGQAARATGKSKATILRAIRSGKISAEKSLNGVWRIEPAEVYRVYPKVSPDTGSEANNGAPRNPQLRFETLLLEERFASVQKDNAHLEAQVGRLEAQVDDLRADRDAWRAMATQKRLTWRGLFGGGKAE